MTPETLAAAVAIPLDRAEKWADLLDRAMGSYEISTPKRQAAFLAQVAHESALFTALVENLNYSMDGLLKTWPKRFSEDLASECARHPERIANIVYGGRMGNVDDGDGWKYRGRGLLQITGRAAYRDAGEAMNLPLEENPDLLLEPEFAALSAAWWWDDHNLNEIADTGDMQKITRIINGGLNGLPHRLAIYQTAMAALC